MNKKILILLLLLPSFAFSKKVINSGHQSQIKFIKYSESEKSFFSLSEDGTLVIKEINSEKLLKRFFLTSNVVSHIEISEFNNQLAIVELNTSSKFVLSVWDWELEKKLYSIELSEFPITIGYSGSGNYIYVSSISSIPVKFFNSKTGQKTSLLNNNTSFVDFIYVGNSEQTAYLYSSSGSLDIWYLKESKQIKTLKTEKNLTNLTLTTDKRYLIGKKNSSIYLIGRNDGQVYQKIDIPDLESFNLNQTTNELICYTNNKYKKSIKIYQLVGGAVFDSNINEILIKDDIGLLNSAFNKIIYSDKNGNLLRYDRWIDEHNLFLGNNILNIESITIIEDKSIILTNDKIFIFTSPFFSDKIKNSKRLTSFTLTSIVSPLTNPIGSMEYNKNLLMWNSDIVLLNLETGETIYRNSFTSDIVDVKIRNSKLLVLDKNGIVKIINLETFKIEFTFKSPGFTSVGFFSDNEIIGGVEKSQGGSLLITDLKTKETIPLSNSLDVVFNIIESKKENILYLSGLNYSLSGNITKFIEFNLKTKMERSLIKYDSEILSSSYDIDEESNIYTNLGTKSLLKIQANTNRIKPFQQTTNQTKSIVYNSGAIFSINENKSLSIWQPNDGNKIIDFYLFKDSEWVAITQDKISAFGSPNSEKYISSN